MTQSKTNYFIIAAIFFILYAGIFSYMTNEPHWDDENMYVGAGVLLQNNTLYQDFPFLQMPYLPLIYGAIYKLTGTSYYLLTTEIINFLFMAIACLIVYFISLTFTRNILFSLGIVMLFLFNDITIYAMKYSANTIVPITFSLLGFYLYVISRTPFSIRRSAIFFSGVAFAFAIGTKLYYAVMLPPIFFMSLFFPGSMTLKLRLNFFTFPFVIGVMLGLVPVYYYLFNDTEIFMFNNLGFHQLNTIYRAITGYTHTMTIGSKLNFGIRILKLPSNIALFIGNLFLLFVLFAGQPNKKQSFFVKSGIENLLLIALVLFSSITVFIPTPLWLHYFALPLPFTVILLANSYRHLTFNNKRIMNYLLTCLVLVSFLGSGTILFKHIGQIFNSAQWSSVVLHRNAEQLRASLQRNNENLKIATLYPLYALEANLPIYKELSTGSFLFRMGELLPENIIDKYGYVSSQNIFELLRKDPPRGILVDDYQNYDLYKSFIQFAEQYGYHKVQKNFQGMTLYISPP
jgi:hypothetical protein